MSRPTAESAACLLPKYLVEVMVRTNQPHAGELETVHESRHDELPDALAAAHCAQLRYQQQHPDIAVMAHVSLDADVTLHLGWFEDCNLDASPQWHEQDVTPLEQLNPLIAALQTIASTVLDGEPTGQLATSDLLASENEHGTYRPTVDSVSSQLIAVVTMAREAIEAMPVNGGAP